jgi:PAS domain S-box-containing protein
MNTICLYLQNNENCCILKEMLQDTFLIIEAGTTLPDEPFDICITDGIILDRNAENFITLKQSAAPLFLPILLLTEHYSPDLFTRDWWQVVDEVTLIPVRKALFLKRIQTLIRSRIQSLAIQREKEELAEANTRIQLGMKTGKISYWEVALDNGDIILSEEWKAQLGCPDQFDNAQTELFSHMHPDDVEPFRNELQQIIHNRAGALSVVYRMSCFAKDYSWFILRSSFIDDLNGNPVRLLVSQIDITEQKRLELQYIESEKNIAEANSIIQKHRLFVDAIMKSSQAGIIYVNKDGCVVDVNKTMTEMLGLPESEIIGRKEQPFQWGIIEPADHSTPSCSSMPVYRSINEHKIIRPKEYLFRRDGVVKTYSLSAAPVLGEDNDVTGGISVWLDVTVQKRVEEALLKSNERYHTLFESIDEGYCIIEMLFDQDGKPVDYKFLEVNPSFQRQTGIENAAGKRMREIAPEFEESWFEIFSKVALTGQPVRFENPAEQYHRWFDVYAFRIGQPENRQVAILFKDISTRKKTEEELRQANELIRNITLGTEDMIAAQDNHFNYIFFNKAYQRVFKKLWSWNLTIGSNMAEVLSPWPDQRQKAIDLWTRAFKGESFRITDEFGPTETSKRIFDLQFSPLRDEIGRVTGAAHIMRDITELIHAKDSIRKNQERLIGVLESMPDAFISFDVNLQFTYVNRHAESLHQKRREEILGKDIREVFQDADTAIKIGKFENILSRQEPESFVLYNSGNDRWYEFRGFPTPDGLSVFVKDISDQKRAAAALKESETRFRTLADNISQFTWMADPNGLIFWFNKRWYEYTGTDLEAMKGWGWKKVHHPDHVSRVVKKIQHSWNTGELWEDTFPLRRHDGTYRWFLSRAMPIRNEKGDVLLWFGTHTDISELRETEEKLKGALIEAEEGRNILTALMKNIPLGIAIAEAPDVKVQMISEFGSRMMMEPGQAIAGSIADLHISHLAIMRSDGVTPDTSDELPLNRATLKGELVKNEEWIVKRRDGTTIPILCNAGPIRDNKGNVTGGIVGWSDETEQLKYRHELERYTEELATANSDLESFTYSVSHDLRTPLLTIRSFAQFLLEDYAEQLEVEGQDYLRRIDGGVKKMQTLIDDMLTLSRVSRHEMDRQDVDFSTMVRNYLQELKESAPNRPVEYVIQEKVHLNADPRLIHLAMENLLRNAWKFTDKNQVTRIEFGTISRHNQTVCFIRDNGVGFDMRFAEKIFEPFKRVHTEKEFSGSGVGLSIVQRVIGRHGGKVWAESEPGKGATFYFTLH